MKFTALLLFAALAVLTAVAAEPLINFQLTQPPVVPKIGKRCTIRILKRDFAYSYYVPEIVQFTPPTDCGPVGSWVAVTLNFTSAINGTQYDRLGIFTFHNVEIWRMTTSQPLRGDGVVWSYVKDVSRYIPLFAKSGTFILQLDNIIQPGLDGVFASTVEATFYASSRQDPPAKRSDLIIPLSTLKQNEGNHASVPPGFSINVTVPQNAVQIYAELHASGNANEEFWYLNAANDFIGSLPPDTTPGQGPFREVRLLVDGRIAGVAFPYPTIFTGGYVPAAWKPIPAYPAHDLPTYFIDLTPFVPVLTDGKQHTITIDVASGENDHTILENWYVSGILQVFTSDGARPTRGRITEYNVEPYAKSSVSGAVNSETGVVDIKVEATRRISIAAEIIEGTGRRNQVRWTQDLTFANKQRFSDEGSVMNVQQSTKGRINSRHNGVSTVLDNFDYPLQLNFTVSGPNYVYRKLEVDHTYDRYLLPLPIVVRSKIQNHQIASKSIDPDFVKGSSISDSGFRDGLYTISPTGNFGNGSNSNIFSFVDFEGNTYRRRVDASFNNITLDVISGNLANNQLGASGSYRTPGAAQIKDVVDVARFPGQRGKK